MKGSSGNKIGKERRTVGFKLDNEPEHETNETHNKLDLKAAN